MYAYIKQQWGGCTVGILHSPIKGIWVKFIGTWIYRMKHTSLMPVHTCKQRGLVKIIQHNTNISSFMIWSQLPVYNEKCSKKCVYKRDFIGVEALSAIIHEKIGYRSKQTHQMASCLLALVAFHKVADSICAPHSSTCRFWFMTTVVTYSRPFLSKPGVSHPDNSFCWLKVPRTKVCGWVQEGTV